MFTWAAYAATKITVGRCRWWGLHKFSVPIKMISLIRFEMSQKSGTRFVNWPRLYSRFLNTFLFEMVTWLSAFVRGLDGMEEEMEWRGKPCRESRDDAAGV